MITLKNTPFSTTSYYSGLYKRISGDSTKDQEYLFTLVDREEGNVEIKWLGNVPLPNNWDIEREIVNKFKLR